MTSEKKFLLDWSFSFHWKQNVSGVHLLQMIMKPYLPWIVGIHFFDEQVLGVSGNGTGSPRDAPIMANRKVGHPRIGDPYDVYSGRYQMSFVPYRRQGKGQMRVTGEDRFASGCALTSHYPTVDCRCAGAHT